MCIFAQIFLDILCFLSNLRRNSRKDREQSIFQSLNIHFLYKKTLHTDAASGNSHRVVHGVGQELHTCS